MSTRKLVVTGGYGFVGTHLLIAAAQGGYDLVVLDDLSVCDGRYLQQIPHRLVKGDIRDESVVAQALEGAEAVLPALQAVYQDTDHKYAGQVSSKVTTAYNSSVQAPMSRDDLRCHLVENGLLDGA